MKVIGICDGHDSGACLFENKAIKAAVSEERMTGQKRQAGFPYRSIAWCLESTGNFPAEIDRVMVAEKSGRLVHRLLDPIYRKSNPNLSLNRWTNRVSAAMQNGLAQSKMLGAYEQKLSNRVLVGRLARLGFRVSPEAVDHHHAHALTAAGASGFSNALVVTMDAFGDGISTTLWKWREGFVEELERIPFPHSPALLYGMVTAYLGFVEGDEGKVSGLAAWGNPDRSRTFFDDWFKKSGGSLELNYFPKFNRLVAGLKGISPKDVAAGAQASIQSAIARFISNRMKKSGQTRLCLAGGLFANVRLNQEVMKVTGAEDIFVFPHMGDGGLCVGAALAAYDPVPTWQFDPFLGPTPGNPEGEPIAEAQWESNRLDDSTLHRIAKDLNAGHAVALTEGKLEFGPRALGHRSILFSAKEKAFAEKLNMALERPTIMPFAPVARAEDWKSITDTPLWSAFYTMAVTADALPGLEKKYPVAVHADGTMRVQVLSEGSESTMAKILTAYGEIDHPPLLINTSFNRHSEPICTDLKKGLDLFARLPIKGLIAKGAYLRKRGEGAR